MPASNGAVNVKRRAIARCQAAAYLPTVKLCNAVPPAPAARGAAGAVARLKINYAQMQNRFTNEFVTKCWVAVNASERLALSEAERRFYTAIHLAVMAYADEVRLGHPAPERRCMICEKPLSQCYC